MPERPRHFLWSATGGDPAELAATLTPGYTLETSARRSQRRRFLDTFDWRLYRAGVELEYDGASLQARMPGGRELAVAAGRLRLPLPSASIPHGALAEEIVPIVAPRALLLAVEDRIVVRVARLRNSDQKVVARLRASIPATPGSPTHLTVSALRGYAADADAVGLALAGRPDMAPTAVGEYAEALRHAARRPATEPDSLAAAMTPGMSAESAIALVLTDFATAMAVNAPGVIDDIDPEFLHDFRVAVRRTRSVLKLTGDVLPAHVQQRFVDEFRWLGDVTTPVRDLDVFLAEFPELIGRLTAAKPDDLAPLRAFLIRHRAAQRRPLVRALRSARFATLQSDWRAALLGAATERHGKPSAAQIATERVSAAHRKVIRIGRRITPESPGETVHGLRKRCKEFRYLLETFAPLHDPAAHSALIRQLKSVQDVLGDFQDGEVQRQAIRSFAEKIMAGGGAQAPSMMAMGELAAAMDAHQLAARAQLAAVLKRFLRRTDRTTTRALLPDDGAV